jgi:hypothetical protein
MTTSDPKPDSKRATADAPVSAYFARQVFNERWPALTKWARAHDIYGITRRTRVTLFDKVIEPAMTGYAGRYGLELTRQIEDKANLALDEVARATARLKHFDEFVCPTCKEPRHPKSTVCWKCAHEGMRKSYSANAEAYAKLQSYLRTQRTVLKLAVNALGRSARQKKKGPFVRQARALLEAALAEPEPGDLSMSLLMKLGIGAVGIFGAMAAYWGVSAYTRSKVGAWGSTADAGPPPTAEELAASP